MGIGIKKEAEQPCRRSLPCHRKVDESITRLQHGIESSWIIGLMETESIGPGGGWEDISGFLSPWLGGGYKRKVKACLLQSLLNTQSVICSQPYYSFTRIIYTSKPKTRSVRLWTSPSRYNMLHQ